MSRSAIRGGLTTVPGSAPLRSSQTLKAIIPARKAAMTHPRRS